MLHIKVITFSEKLNLNIMIFFYIHFNIGTNVLNVNNKSVCTYGLVFNLFIRLISIEKSLLVIYYMHKYSKYSYLSLINVSYYILLIKLCR